MIIERLDYDQRTVERPETLMGEAPLRNKDLLAFCRASKELRDQGLPRLYHSICIRNLTSLSLFWRTLKRNPQLTTHVRHLYWVKALFNRQDFQLPDNSSGPGLILLGHLLQILQQGQTIFLFLYMPHDDVHVLNHCLHTVTAERTQAPTPIRTLTVQLYMIPGETHFPLEAANITLLGDIQQLVYKIEGSEGLSLSPQVPLPLPISPESLAMEGIHMSLESVRRMLMQCPALKHLSWELNTDSWSDILTGNNAIDSGCLQPVKGRLEEILWVNREYAHELPQRFLAEDVLVKPLECFSTLARLTRLRIDLEGLTRATVNFWYLPGSLENLEVVVACEDDFHRHSYQPDVTDREARKAAGFFDWGDKRDTWLSLCIVKLHRSAKDGLLPNLRSLVVDHELDLDDMTLIAATKNKPQWKAYFTHYATVLGGQNISFRVTWSPEKGAPPS